MIIIASVFALVSPVQAWDGDIWWDGPAFDYAPNMWFGSTEELYPTSPFFDDEDLSGEDNKNDYYNLSFDQKMDNFVVYYTLSRPNASG